MSTSIPASLCCTCFDIAQQIFSSLSTFRANPIIVHIGQYSQPTVTPAHFPVHLPLSSPRVILCAFVTIEPPYSIPDPRELTAHLCHNWLRLGAQNRTMHQGSHRPEPTQVERHVPLTHNTTCLKETGSAQQTMLRTIFLSYFSLHVNDHKGHDLALVLEYVCNSPSTQKNVWFGE
jgi:hypothetical protein